MKHASVSEFVEKVQTWDPRKQGAGSTLRYIDIGSVSQVAKVIEDPPVILAEEAPSRARQLVKAGDILISTVRPNLNAVALVPDDLDGATASTGFSVLRPDDTQLDRNFLFHWVRTQAFVSEMMRQATGQSYPAVSDKIVKASKIPLPSLEEQRRIAGILDQADALRRLRTRALDKLNTLGQAIFHEMFGDLRTNPFDWPQTRYLGEIAEVASGITKGRKTKTSELREVPYLAVANVQDRHLKLDVVKTIKASEAEIERFKLKKNDILLTEGGDPDKLGRGTLWNDEMPECIHQNHVFRVRVEAEDVSPIFLSWQIGSPAGKAYFLKLAKQTTGIASINKTQLKGFPVLLPPLELQQEFEQRLSALAGSTATSVSAHTKMEGLFLSLQHRAFQGEL